VSSFIVAFLALARTLAVREILEDLIRAGWKRGAMANASGRKTVGITGYIPEGCSIFKYSMPLTVPYSVELVNISTCLFHSNQVKSATQGCT
jgi:hypothetical protein